MTRDNLRIDFDASVGIQDLMWLLGADYTPENAERVIRALDWDELECLIDDTITDWLRKQKDDAKIAEIVRSESSEG